MWYVQNCLPHFMLFYVCVIIQYVKLTENSNCAPTERMAYLSLFPVEDVLTQFHFKNQQSI